MDETTTSKPCAKCGEVKDFSEFSTKNANRPFPMNLNARCKPCVNEERREKMGKSWSANSRREHQLKRDYGICLEDYNSMFAYQRGCCAICGTHQNELVKSLHVDHDHSTGEVRALLCGTCNAGLGMYRDDPELLEIAAEYLRLHAD